MVRYFDSLLGLLRDGGFTYDLAHHALHALGSRALGFTQELFDPDDNAEGDTAATEMLEQMADQLPYLVGMLKEVAHDDPDSTLGWCDAHRKEGGAFVVSGRRLPGNFFRHQLGNANSINRHRS